VVEWASLRNAVPGLTKSTEAAALGRAISGGQPHVVAREADDAVREQPALLQRAVDAPDCAPITHSLYNRF
jgi:hypothetical protein